MGEEEHVSPTQTSVQSAIASLRGVSKHYGQVLAADDLNLEINKGEFLTFLGPSGCGKTTALRMLAGFETPTTGEVLLDGEVVNTMPSHLRPVNMVFQHYALFPHMSVEKNIAYGLKQRRPRIANKDIEQKVKQALELVRLEEFGKRRVWEMSGGQQQRVALARAIINEPKLLLLDEPLAALDRKLRKEMQIELADIQRRLGITFVLVTHDQEEALSMSDRICIMREGCIEQIGTPQQLYDQPTSRYVAGFVGTTNFFDGRIERSDENLSMVQLSNGQVFQGQTIGEFEVGNQASISIRPEQMRLSRVSQSEYSLLFTVQNRIFLGEHTEYLIKHDTLGECLALTSRQSEIDEGTYSVGEQIFAIWEDSSARVFHLTDT